ncbi:energy-coupling factor ABC transporter ATP-binding protein [Pseudalkalibacillus berkeleyi]|uniref:Energy-coupling factor transporter ATP-binding protein EcfA2 n=1 Tax=Pseudalkalibacillus berkeleyi TaxID=1069813 RepID=A0ABS9H6E3_9BACL|nr:energy-coupling factor ABC transporter ATP-binding protein [Pseudalkalibacillus berkeleyi]MCF6139443.1 energy-coupling factor ABC transporter ATP-binding protein [Pseudalkalibacillus berkeleyi]
MELSTEQVAHIYSEGTPKEHRALYDVSINVPAGSFYAIIGHTGSGKSTLIQHLNGLLKPTSGAVHIGSKTIRANEKAKQLKEVRKRVGMVFQYPEHQLFEETIEKDICFGPLNFGVDEKTAKNRAKETLRLVGLNDEYLERSPFELSGGQMRRVAIAGVLAMNPEVLILDEPTAGLDPSGQREMMELFISLQKEKNITIILVTHSMEDAARYADKIFVMANGTLFMEGSPKEIFEQEDKIREAGLDIPESTKFIQAVQDQFGTTLEAGYTIEEAVDLVDRIMKVGSSK